jgi:hypothetical protein
MVMNFWNCLEFNSENKNRYKRQDFLLDVFGAAGFLTVFFEEVPPLAPVMKMYHT